MKIVIALFLLSCLLAASQAFRCEEAPRFHNVKQIDAGHGVLVGASTYQTRMLSGRNWYQLGNVNLHQVSIGPSGMWGVDRNNRVHKMVGSNFLQAQGTTMKMVAAGGNGVVLGIRASDNRTFCLTSSRADAFRGVGSLTWTDKTKIMKQVSCGPYSCWGVDTLNRVYVLQRLSSTCGSLSWTQVSGSMKMVKVGEDGRVFGVTPAGRVCERTSVSSTRQRGSSWRDYNMCFAVEHLAYDQGILWVASRSGLLMECTQ